MTPDRSTPSTAAGCLSHFGLLVIVGIGALSAGCLAMLLPPWVKVDCQRRQVLYWSESVEDYDSSFAGYHWLLAERDWQTERSEPARTPNSGEYFDVTEYRIFWGLLIGEWVVIGLGAAGLFVLLARGLIASPDRLDATGESHPLPPATGPVSDGEAPPPTG